VPRRGLPCMRKHRRNLSGSHRASIEIDCEEHAASSRVGQSTEDILIRVSPHPRSRLRHQEYSAILLNNSQHVFTANAAFTSTPPKCRSAQETTQKSAAPESRSATQGAVHATPPSGLSHDLYFSYLGRNSNQTNR
jgi:hypothetical protein